MATEPCLNLKVDIKPFSETSEWDSTNNLSNKEISALQQSIGVGQKYVQTMQNRLPGLIMNQVREIVYLLFLYKYLILISFIRWRKHFRW